MGRSVSIPSDAVLVAYDYLEAPEPTCFHCGQGEPECECSTERSDVSAITEDGFSFEACYDDEGLQDDWEYYYNALSDKAGRLWPSLRDAGSSCWAGREDRVLRENAFAQFGISEYCGLVAIWMRLHPDVEGYVGSANHVGLAEAWLNKIASKFQAEFGVLHKVATFSTGEAVFRRSA